MALKVIGAGLGRTGTLSLKLALERLGFGPCYHMLEIMGQARQRLPQWLDVVANQPDWDAIFSGYASTVDYPSCTYWRELAAHFPNAKVVLSDRDAGEWYDSVRQTIFSPANIQAFMGGDLAPLFRGALVGPFIDHLDDRAWMIDYFDSWREQVIAGIPPERLLVLRLGDGWKPLCEFLGTAVPQEPYPRVNSKSDMQAGAQETNDDGAGEIPTAPDAMEKRMQSYLAAMEKLAWS